MEKFLAFAVIASFASFFITPSLSFTRSPVMTDDDLGAVVGKSGSVTLTDYTIQSTPLKSVLTDGLNYWETSNGLRLSPYLINNAYWFFSGAPENNPPKNPGSGIFDTTGYFEYDSYFTADLIKQSGSITLKPLDITSTDTVYQYNPNYQYNPYSPDYINLNSQGNLFKNILDSLSANSWIDTAIDIKVDAIPGNCLEETAIIRHRGDISATLTGSPYVVPH
ncbi:MAG: hypothetical protein ACLQBQ_05815 [Smithella sp.]